MTELGVLAQGRANRALRAAQARRARRVRRARNCLLGLMVGLLALLAFMTSVATSPHFQPVRSARRAVAQPPAGSGYTLTPASRQLRFKPKLALRSGVLFDVRHGRVLWQRAPQEVLPIASLTKMMTALVVVAHARPSAQVRITRAAVNYSGSGVGVLPPGKRVSLMTLLYGLMLPSGNDAAIALAQHVGGSQRRFVAMMNARAREMHLACTHFSSPSGIVDQGNHSCAVDLAVIAHAVLEQPLLARIVASRSAVMPLPVKGGKVYLYNNNPLLILRYPGADGVKTGYTVAAGRCLVAAARRGRKWLAVVLLHSDDPPDQAQELLNAGFSTRGA